MPNIYIVLTVLLVTFAISIFVWVKMSKARIRDNRLNSDNNDERAYNDYSDNTGDNL
jgi:hypothetical protein